MTVTSTTSRMPPYAGNGAATAFPVDIPFPAADCVRAILSRPGQPDADLVRDTDFTLTGAGDPNGGTLTFPKAGSAYGVLAAGEHLHILRVLPLTQERAWDNVDAIDAEEIEAGDDRLTMIAQQLQEQLDRALVFPATAEPQIDPAAYSAEVAAARDAAQTAQSAAETARTGAETARTGAETARAGAEAALAATQAEHTAAVADIQAEGAAQVAAVTAEGDAQDARVTAEGNTQDARVVSQGDTQVARVIAEGDAQVARVGGSHAHDDRYYTEGEVDAKLAGKSDTGHGHAISNVTGLQTALDAKLAAAAQAVDSDKLDGMQPATAATANTIAQRDASGNLTAGILYGTATSARYA
ncbi:MAG: hypothetical protein AB1916_13225 [Thermodesulfobacteriota bacterium]